MQNNRGWVVELVIVGALIAAFVVGAIALSCCTCRGLETWFADQVIASWFWVLLQFALSGAFGGFLLLLSQFDPKDVIHSGDDYCDKFHRCNIMFAILHSCFGGVGGAMAFLFLMIYNDKLTHPLILEEFNILKYCVSGVVSGFIGFALLRAASEWINKLTNVEDAAKKAGATAAKEETKGLDVKTADLVRRADSLTKKVADIQRLQYVLQMALELWNDLESGMPVAPERFQNILAQLEDARRPLPENRMAAMVLGNLYRNKREYRKSVEIVSETLAVIEPQTREGDEASRKIALKNVADLHWNRANYLAGLALLVRESDPALHESYKTKMYADLERSLELSPDNINDVEEPTDPDFGDLVKETRFLALLAKYKKPVAS